MSQTPDFRRRVVTGQADSEVLNNYWGRSGLIVFDDETNQLAFYTGKQAGARYVGEGRANHVMVKSADDFPEPENGVHQLLPNTAYHLNGIITTQHPVVYGEGSYVYGVDPGNDVIMYLGTDAALKSEGARVGGQFFSVIAPSGAGVDFSAGTDVKLTLFLIGIVNSAVAGYIDGFDISTFHKLLVENCGEGLTFSGETNKTLLSLCAFQNMAEGSTAVKFDETYNAVNIDISSSYFKPDEVTFAIEWNENAQVDAALINNNIMVDGMFVGLDNTDPRFSFSNNSDLDNSRPQIGIYTQDNSTPTELTQDVWSIPAGETLLKSQNRFEVENSYQIQYIGRRPTTVLFSTSWFIESLSSNQDLEIGLFKNGDLVEESVMRVSLRGSEDKDSVSTIIFADVETGDILEPRIRNITSSANAIVRFSQIAVVQ